MVFIEAVINCGAIKKKKNEEEFFFDVLEGS